MSYVVTAILMVVEGFAFSLAFVLLARRSKGSERRRDSSSMIGFLLQMGGLFIALGLFRPPFTPLLQISPELDRIVDLVCCTAAALLALSAILLTVGALKALGSNWAYAARILDDHKLIRSGPYALVRHPIYTSMISMNVAYALAFSRWEGVIVCIVLSLLGTWIRVRSEERLMSQAFGSDFTAYAASVPAIVPWSLLRGRAAAVQ